MSQMLGNVLSAGGNQEAAISSVALVELAHGVYRANTAERRERRQSFVDELVAGVPVHPFTGRAALLAGRMDGEQRAKGAKIPFRICSSELPLSIWAMLWSPATQGTFK